MDLLKKAKESTAWDKYFSADIQVNNEIAHYFRRPLNKKLGVDLMDKNRMIILFVSVYNHPNLTNYYRNKIHTWLEAQN